MKKKEYIKLLGYSHDFLASVIYSEFYFFQLQHVSECFDIHIESFKELVSDTFSLEAVNEYTPLSKQQVATIAQVMLEHEILSTKTLIQR